MRTVTVGVAGVARFEDEPAISRYSSGLVTTPLSGRARRFLPRLSRSHARSDHTFTSDEAPRTWSLNLPVGPHAQAGSAADYPCRQLFRHSRSGFRPTL